MKKGIIQNKSTTEDTVQDAFCGKCGSKIAYNAERCPSCGCKTEYGVQHIDIKDKKRVSVKKIVLIAILVVALVAAIIVGMLVWKHIRTEQVKEQLAGKKFFNTEVSLYSANHSYFEFDDEGVCTYYYYYSNVMDKGTEYKRDYEIKFEKGMVFLVFLSDTFEVQYDKYGEIEGLYDIDTKKLYD